MRDTPEVHVPNQALREGTCDQTPFEVSRFPLSIRNRHFVLKTAQNRFF